MNAPVTALAGWFGGKRTLAPKIVEVLGPHQVYWEPFCGSMAVLFAKPPCRQETVNDLHGDLVNLARTVADEDGAVKLYTRCARTLFSETLFRESAEIVKRPMFGSSDDRAYHFFVTSWMGMNGTGGTATSSSATFARRYTSNGGSPAKRFSSAVESIPAWHERLRSVIILSGCGIELCERIEDKPGTVIYCDPPYLVKGAKYQHDFAIGAEGIFGCEDDHMRLARSLARFRRTRVVVSYYDHADLEKLYPGWEKLDCSMSKALTSSGRRIGGVVVAPEVLLVNRRDAEPNLFGGE